MRLTTVFLIGAAAAFAQTETPHAIGILNYVHAVSDVDKSVAFYRDVIGLEVNRAPSDFPNVGVPALVNATGVHLKLGTMKMSGQKYVVELTQFSGIERHPGERDIETILTPIRKSGVPIITRLGAPVAVGPNGA